MTRLLIAALLTLWPAIAVAALTQRQIETVALEPAADARVPTSLVFRDVAGEQTSLAEAIANRPTVLLPADYNCRQICGPALTIVSAALQQTGLVAGLDYSLVVVGIDAKDSLADARRFAEPQVSGVGVSVLTGSAKAIESLTAAIGYHFEPDAAQDAIAHPAALLTLFPDGRVSRALSSLALQPQDLRLALIEASQGKVGGIAGKLSLLCYGFDAARGVYTQRIQFILQIAGALTVTILGCAVIILLMRGRRRGAAR